MGTLLPFLFSIIIPGAGQLYLRDYWKGILMIFLSLFLWLLVSFIPPVYLYIGTMIWSLFDIYLKTEKKEGKSKAVKNLLFSFIVVVFIIPGIFYLSLVSFSKGGEYASNHYFNENNTQIEMTEIAKQLDSYFYSFKKYPTDYESFVRTKPIWDGWLTDSWKNKYNYSQTDSLNYTLTSAGEDGEFGTSDDIIKRNR